MDKIIAYIRKLVGLELTIDRVTARQSKVVRDLDKLEGIYKDRCTKATKKAEKAAKAANAASEEAAIAAQLSTNWKNSGLVRTERQAEPVMSADLSDLKDEAA